MVKNTADKIYSWYVVFDNYIINGNKNLRKRCISINR